MVSQGTLAFVLSVFGGSALVQAAGFPSCSQLTYCARGGSGQNLSRGNINTLPRCWYQFDYENEFGCYDPLEGSCNNIRGVNMFDTNRCRKNPKPNPKPSPRPKPQPPSRKGAHPTCSQLTRCAHGGKDQYVEDGSIDTLPRCWYRRPNEKEFGCFLPVNDSCNNIEGVDMFDTTTCGGSPKPKPKPQPPSNKGVHPTCSQLKRCAHGGNDKNLEDGNINTLPRCWYKFPTEKEFGCYLPYKGSCNDIKGVDMFDTTTCGGGQKPKPKPTPNYLPCPDLTVDVCTSAKTNKRISSKRSLRYWAWDSDKWVCGTSKKLLKNFKNIVDLHAPPSRCLVKNQSPYSCQ